MKVIFFGLGSIGKRHAGILKKSFGHELYAYRSGKSACAAGSGIKEVHDWDGVMRIKPEVAFITNPTHMHMDTALRCAEQGMHLFIEKPLADRLEGIDRLRSLCRKKGLACYTAYCMRFHPVIKKLRALIKGKRVYHVNVLCSSYLPEWMPGRDHRASYRSRIGTGGGALLELSHEFDYIQYLFGPISSMSGVYGRLSDITIDAEDFADILLTTEDSVQVNLHIDFLSLKDERTVRADFKGGYITADLIRGDIVYRYKGRERRMKVKISRDAYLTEQAGYFFRNIANPMMMNGLSEAGSLLGKIIRLKDEKRKDTCGHRRSRWLERR